MSSFFAAYWIVWAVLLAYVTRLRVRQRQLERQIATLTEAIHHHPQLRRNRDGDSTRAA